MALETLDVSRPWFPHTQELIVYVYLCFFSPSLLSYFFYICFWKKTFCHPAAEAVRSEACSGAWVKPQEEVVEVPRWAAPSGLPSSAARAPQKVPCRKDTSLAGSCWRFMQVMLTLLSCGCWPGLPCAPTATPTHGSGLGPKNSGKSGDKAGDSPAAALNSQGNPPVTLLALLGQGHETDNVRANVWHQGGDNAAPRVLGWAALTARGRQCTPAHRRRLLAAPRHLRQVAHVPVDGHQFLVTHRTLGGRGWCLTVIAPTWWVQTAGRALQGTAYVQSHSWTIN